MMETINLKILSKNNVAQSPSAVILCYGNTTRGFSLIELLVAIGIIALLVAIGVGVGVKVLGQGKIKATKANMILIMNAIETYHDEFSVYPGDTSIASSRTRTCKQEFVSNVSMSSQLWGYTARTNYTPPNSRDKLKGLPEKVIVGQETITGTGSGSTSTETITFNFADSFGNAMLYSANGGLGGTPVLFSAGPDGLFGPDIEFYNGSAWVNDSSEAADAEDNIRSDK